MQQLVDRRRDPTLPAPVPLVSLQAQLEASIQSPPVGRLVRVALLTLAITMVPFFGWATMTTIERAVLATGQLIPEGRRKTINLLEPGILRRLEVREGSVVQAGQVLVQLDVTQAESTADAAKAALWSGRAKIARLKAEQADQRELVFPESLEAAAAADPSITTYLNAERQLFAARWSAYDGQLQVQDRAITQLQEQVSGARATRTASEAQVRSVREQIAGLSRLLTQGFASRFTILELQRTEQQIVATIGTSTAQEAQLREGIIQAQAQLTGIRLTRLSEIATDLQTTEPMVAQAQQQLRAAQDILTRREVVAPEAGKVTNIQAFTPGATIGAGQPILDLVPVRDRFIVEAQINPVDIEQVEVGQPANIRLSSYRQRRVPLLPGQVIYISADSQPAPGGGGQQIYIARLEFDATAFEAMPEVVLTAGMPTENYILGEKRSPLSYLIGPIRNSARRIFRD